MRLTPEEVLDNPITEDAILVFQSGVIVCVDELIPVQNPDESYVDHGNGNIRLAAQTDQGFTMYFDSADLLYIELGTVDTDTVMMDRDVYDGPDQEPVDLDDDDEDYFGVTVTDEDTGSVMGLDEFLSALTGMAFPHLMGSLHRPQTFGEKTFLDHEAQKKVEGFAGNGEWAAPRF